MSQNLFLNIWMELALQLGPVHVMATNDQCLKLFLLGSILQELGDYLIVPPEIIFLMTLRMAGIVSGISIASTMTWNRVHKNTVVTKLFKLNIEKTCPLAVPQRNPQARVFREDWDQRFEMKAPVNKKLGGCRHGGHIKLIPNAARAAREHGFGARLVAVQSFGKLQDSFKVVQSFSVAAVKLQLLHSFSN